jgi:hypothetical protein
MFMYKDYDPKALRAAVTAGSFWVYRLNAATCTYRVSTVRFYGYTDNPESMAIPENYWVYFDDARAGDTQKFAPLTLDRFMDYYIEVTDPLEIEEAVFERAKYRTPAKLKRELGNKHLKHLSAETKGILLLQAASNY